MTPYYEDDHVQLWHGDCLGVLADLPAESIDAVVTDPPYGLEFMGKSWDRFKTDRRGVSRTTGIPAVPGVHGEWSSGRPQSYDAGGPFQLWCTAWATECLRVLKPGGHMLAFGGTRTWHRLAAGVEDAGFELRDSIAWLYGSGFPKSMDVSKAIDKAAGAERETKGWLTRDRVGVFAGDGGYTTATSGNLQCPDCLKWKFAPDYCKCPRDNGAQTPDAAHWQGWGTALKPAWESVVVGRKPPALCDRIGSRLDTLEYACRRLVNGAARSSAPTRHDSPEATTATAPASAATPPEGDLARTTRTGAAADSSETTATSWSEWQATTCSNIVTSWKRSLAVVSQPTSTSTTATTSGTTIDLTTLWSSLSQIAEPSTLLSETSPDGLSSLARIVDDLFGAALLNWRATRTLTATEPATSATPPDSQDGGARLSPIVVARKPLTGTVAANVLQWGTGALNVDGCRVGTDGGTKGATTGPQGDIYGDGLNGAFGQPVPGLGRWPTNVVLDDSQAAELDEQSGESASKAGGSSGTHFSAGGPGVPTPDRPRGGHDTGGASHFFPTFRYEAKAPASERPKVDGTAHPTVKPLDLMRWLVRLVTPPGGTVLEPFAGSGTTVEACLLEGFQCIAIEREADYLPLITQRIKRRRDPIAYLEAAGEDLGLFGGAA